MLFRSHVVLVIMCADTDYSQDSSCLSVSGQDSTSEYSASEYSAGLSAPGQLIDAEDSHLLVGNTYPVKSQLVSSKMVTANSKPKIKRRRGVWICEGDGLSVAGGDIQRVYRGWCDWVLARGRGLSL